MPNSKVLYLLIGMLSFAPAFAADLKAEEAAIRAVIAKTEPPKLTTDAISWTGAYKRPSVGSQKSESFPEANIGKRQNRKAAYDVQRIEVAASGDMAYEFSYGKLEYDTEGPLGKHVTINQGMLRVWKKDGGEWKVAASFIRPLDVPFTPIP